MIDVTRAAYKILDSNGFYGPDDHLYPEGEEIYFDGEPNEQMEPLNDLAKFRLIKHIERLERETKAAYEKLGKPYAGRPRSFDGAIVLATELQRSGVVLMGAKKENKTVKKVHEEGVPETGEKRGRGRPPGAKNRPKLSVDFI